MIRRWKKITKATNGTVTATDWVQVGLFAAGLQAATNGSEFQKADCAPRTDSQSGSLVLGNGSIPLPGSAFGSIISGLLDELDRRPSNAASVQAMLALESQYEGSPVQTTRTYLQGLINTMTESCDELLATAPSEGGGGGG